MQASCREDEQWARNGRIVHALWPPNGRTMAAQWLRNMMGRPMALFMFGDLVYLLLGTWYILGVESNILGMES